MEQLFQLFDAIHPLSTELKNYLISILTPLYFKKKSVILEEGQIADRIYFIEKGLVRAVELEKGKEKTAWIMSEGEIIFSVESFLLQIPSPEKIEALEDCEFQSITHSQLYEAYLKYPEFNLHRAVFLEKYYPQSEARNRMRQMKARVKFEYLMKTQPGLVTRRSLSDKILASYLGVTPGTYSLQKSLFANRNKPAQESKKKESTRGKAKAKKSTKPAKNIRNRKKNNKG